MDGEQVSINRRARLCLFVAVCVCIASLSVAPNARATEPIGTVQAEADSHLASLPPQEHGPIFSANGTDCQQACDATGCCDCVGCCDPSSWTASVGAIYLHRSPTSDAALLRLGNLSANTPTDPVIFNSKDFDFEHELGYVVDMSRHNGLRSFQVRHFGVDGWDDSFRYFDSDRVFVQMFPGFYANVHSTSVFEISSEMLSTEANWLGESQSRFTPLAGVRWIRFDERLLNLTNFVIPSTNVPLSPNYSVDTRNDLFGFQLGGTFLLLDNDQFQLTALGKVGVYANDARHHVKYLRTTGPLLADIKESNTATSLVYELGLNGRFKLTDNLSLAGGYMIMWLNNLALAPAQLERNQLHTGAPTVPTAPLGSKHIDTSDDVIVHGGELSLVIEW